MNINKSFSIILISVMTLMGCSHNPNINNDEEIVTKRERPYAHMDKLLGEDTLLFSSTSSNKRSQKTVGIGINSYLWRASLDIVSFMSLRSVDPFGGVIITEWLTPENNHQERFKVDIMITSRTLRADGVRVQVTKQILKSAQWTNTVVDPHIAITFENAILTKARQLYNNSPATN